ncbi:MAG: TIGR03960 family radical SAM protein [Acidimicrobiia bacterium]
MKEFHKACDIRVATAPASIEPPVSLWERLEPLLAHVEKPARYIGSEINLVPPRHDDPLAAKFLLIFPDTYEVGQPNLGLAILYEILNETPGALAERAFAPWPDLEEAMRKRGLPLFSLDNHLPASAFDVLAFTCPSELVYTNVLNLIDLAGYSVRSSQRSPNDPLVIAGGHAVHNPEPLAEFCDALVIGDGEEVILEIASVVRKLKATLLEVARSDSSPRRGMLLGNPGDEALRAKREALLELARLEGVYVPAFYRPVYTSSGRLKKTEPTVQGVPERVERRTVVSIADYPYPKNPLVPLTEVIHDRLNVEVFRGCTRGCRFCQAGMITRPVRERPRQQVERMIKEGLAKTGYEDVSLLSLSSADFSGIENVTESLMDEMERSRVSLSLPSLRVDAFTVGLASQVQRVKKTGLTFAPEAGTWRLRRVINKLITDEDLTGAVDSAFSQGWRRVKLYFMIGLPTETDEDVAAIGHLGNRVYEIGRKYTKHPQVTLSVGVFVPKAHTPFQWASQIDPEEARRRISVIKSVSLRSGVRLRWHDPEASVIEALLSRGDRRVGYVLEHVWRKGGVFQEWSEHFSFERWLKACEASGIDLAQYCYREFNPEEPLPWDHVSVGIYKEWLYEDWQSSLEAGYVEDCRWTPCYDCGVCMTYGVENLVASKTAPAGGSQGTGQTLPCV